MPVQNGKGCGRGVLALKSWKPLRKPGAVSNQNSNPSGRERSTDSNSTKGQQIPVPPSILDGQEPILLVKYSYQANPNQPGGFPEMTVKQGQKVQFLKAHPEHPLWWLVKDQTGENTGYSPASYMMVLEDKPTSLPWLENKMLEENKKEQTQPKTGIFANAPVNNTWKPYVSAYGGGVSSVSNETKKYYCEVCDKQLNGPKPYQAHMVSKAHKEEMEVQRLS